MGNTLFDDYPIRIPINEFFASHIGIFGNTGSGKSNTLHKLFLELFKSEYRELILNKSKFFIIDFNGEYLGNKILGIPTEKKKIFDLNTRKGSNSRKLPIRRNQFLNIDVLKILFNATTATQAPFLNLAIKEFNNLKNHEHFANIELSLFKKIIISRHSSNDNAIVDWLECAKKEYVTDKDNIFEGIEDLVRGKVYGNNMLLNEPLPETTNGFGFTEQQITNLNFKSIATYLSQKYNSFNFFQKFQWFLEFQKIYVSAWGGTNIEYINPLFHRIKNNLQL